MNRYDINPVSQTLLQLIRISFSQDLELIDNDLPGAFDATMVQFLSTIAAAVLVFIGSSYVAAALPVCILCLYLIQIYYLKTSRQLRLLDIEAKAPLFSHFLETQDGIAVIRAYGWTHNYFERHVKVLNNSQKPYYLMWCIQRWLTLVLNLFVTVLATLLVAIATNVRNGSTAFLGVALFNIISFSMDLQNFVTEWTEVETAIGALNRIRTYQESTEQEAVVDIQEEELSQWPSKGKIEIQDLNASYHNSQSPVLKDVNLVVHPKQKIAICGRTGRYVFQY